MFCQPCCVMLAGTALSIHLLVYADLSLFIISGLYVYMVVCIVYAYNLTKKSSQEFLIWQSFCQVECLEAQGAWSLESLACYRLE